MPNETIQLAGNAAEAAQIIAGGMRPLVNRDDPSQFLVAQNASQWPVVQLRHPNGTAVNSILMAEEWEEIDHAITSMPRLDLPLLDDLRSGGLVRTGIPIGVTSVQWRVRSETTGANITMDGQSRVDRDRVDRLTFEQPLPIISKEYRLGWRELETSRRLGMPIDVEEVEETTIATMETIDGLILNGTTTVQINGQGVVGILTSGNGRLAGTAASYGGGLFTTEGNGYSAVQGAIAALRANRYRGPFKIYMDPVSYDKLLAYHTDNGELELDRVMRHPNVSSISSHDGLNTTTGQVLVMNWNRNTIQIDESMALTNREWTSPDGMTFYGRVLAALAVKIKKDYAGNLGICEITNTLS